MGAREEAGGRRRVHGVAAALLAALALMAGAGCGEDDSPEPEPTKAEAERVTLAESERPEGAPGRELALSRVEVPPGVELPFHTHAGTQLGYIDAGTLTFEVKTGSVEVIRTTPEGESQRVRTVRSGETAPIEQGEWIVEQPDVVHRGSNRGDETVVILLSTLFESGEPPAVPAD